MHGKRDPYAALRNPTYALFLLGSMLDIVGNQMQAVAVGWELYQRTHSPAMLVVAGVASP